MIQGTFSIIDHIWEKVHFWAKALLLSLAIQTSFVGVPTAAAPPGSPRDPPKSKKRKEPEEVPRDQKKSKKGKTEPGNVPRQQNKNKTEGNEIPQ